MEQRTETETASPSLYDVLLDGSPPDTSSSKFSIVSVQAVGARTSLRRKVSEASQLDVLLDKVCSLRLRLLDVHRIPGSAENEPTFEVCIDGQVGEPLLRYLSWPASVLPGRTRVRIDAKSEDLCQFLQACTECGAGIDRVRKVSGVGPA